MMLKIGYAPASTSEEASQQSSLCCRSTQFEKRPIHVALTNRKYSLIVCRRCGTIAGLVDETANSVLETIKAGVKRISDWLVR